MIFNESLLSNSLKTNYRRHNRTPNVLLIEAQQLFYLLHLKTIYLVTPLHKCVFSLSLLQHFLDLNRAPGQQRTFESSFQRVTSVKLLFTVCASLIADCVQLPPIKLQQELGTCSVQSPSVRAENTLAYRSHTHHRYFYLISERNLIFCFRTIIILPFVVRAGRQNELAAGSYRPVWSVNTIQTFKHSHRQRSPHKETHHWNSYKNQILRFWFCSHILTPPPKTHAHTHTHLFHVRMEHWQEPVMRLITLLSPAGRERGLLFIQLECSFMRV